MVSVARCEVSTLPLVLVSKYQIKAPERLPNGCGILRRRENGARWQNDADRQEAPLVERNIDGQHRPEDVDYGAIQNGGGGIEIPIASPFSDIGPQGAHQAPTFAGWSR
jgi:hypothetical protein